jgi:hypothetical protein
MLYARVNAGGLIVEYPYSIAQLRADNPRVSIPLPPSAQDLASFGVVPVLRTGRPAEQPGAVVVEGEPIRIGGEWQQSWNVRAETPPELAAAKAAAAAEIDTAAEAARLLFITPGAGQSLEYAATEAEARAYLAAPTNNPTDWPWLNAERLASGGTMTVAQVAQQVLALATAWRGVGAEIKRIRRAAKVAIESAATIHAVRGVVATVEWPVP